MGEKLASLPLEKQKVRIEELLSESGKRVVIFLDDIDRLDKQQIQSVFKLLKLTADFANVSHVLAFDRDVVAQAIAEQYGAVGSRAGYQYLEKIIQVNLNLPLADKESLRQLCINGLNEALQIADVSLTPDQMNEFQTAFEEYIFPELQTPRLAKQYANSVAFVVPLLANEINLVDLLLLEAVKCLFPMIHEYIRKFPNDFTPFGLDYIVENRGKNVQERLKGLMENHDLVQANRAEQILTKLFPQLRGVFRSGQYSDHSQELAQQNQRVSSQNYLLRYLHCSIPSGDISDKEIDAFVLDLGGLEEDKVDERYRQLIHPNEERLLLGKLKSRMGTLPIEAAKQLGLCIARCGSLIPDPPREFFRLFAAAALLIRQILECLQEPDRKKFAIRILEIVEPVGFGALCFSWMQGHPPELEALFSSNDEQDLTRAFAKRISAHASKNSLLTDNAQDRWLLLSIWQRAEGSTPVQEHVRRVLAEEPQAAQEDLGYFFFLY